MNKIIITKPGGYEQLKYVERPDLKPGSEEVLVQTHAAGVNYADVCVRWGVYASAKEFVGWPITPGFEFSGEVTGVGQGVKHLQVGDEVFGVTRFDGYATQIVTAGDLVWRKPANLSFEQAAAFPAVFLTAYHGMFHSVPIRKGMKVLIHSAAGGVGSALVQIAKIHGLEVTGVVGSSNKVGYLREVGCDHVIDKSTDDLWTKARAYSPGGYDLIYDANGPETLRQSYEHLRPTGKLVCYGFHTLLPKQGGRIQYLKAAWGMLRMPRFNPLNMTNQNKSVIAFNLSFLFERKELLNEAMTDLLRWLGEGRLRPPQTRSFALENVAEAHRAIESGKTVGKLVLIC